jgi:RNA polymerase sigma-70 factor, ECF subfamily
LQHRDAIIEGCKQDDRQKQEELYKACYLPMIKVCSRYATDIDEAGAFYNEAMLKVFSNIHQYKGESELLGWIRRIVVNTCIDHCRRQAKFVHQSVDTIPDEGISVNPDVYNRLSGYDITRLLQELPKNTSLVFSLFVLEGYKHEEIGQLLGISAGTSKWHLNEARRLLKDKLDSKLKKEIYSNAI